MKAPLSVCFRRRAESSRPRLTLCFLLSLSIPLISQAQTPRAKAWVHVNKILPISLTPVEIASAYNSVGGVNTVAHPIVGDFDVKFPGLAPTGDNLGTVQVSAAGETSAYCKVRYWENNLTDVTVHVRCFGASSLPGVLGNPADSEFAVLYYAERRRTTDWLGLYMWADQPERGPSYIPDARYQWSSKGGANAVRNLGIGVYAVDVPSTLRPQANQPYTVLATAMGDGSEWCNAESEIVANNAGPQLTIVVRCFTGTGNAVSTKFTLSYFADVGLGADTVMDQQHGALASITAPTQDGVTTTVPQVLNSGGGVTQISRSLGNTYDMSFGGLPDSMTVSLALAGASGLDASGHAAHCRAYPKSIHSQIAVACGDEGGRRAASNFNVLYLTDKPAGNTPPACSVNQVAATATGVSAGDHAAGTALRISASGEVSLARDDRYSTDADGVITLPPSVGSGAYNFFQGEADPIGIAPARGNRKSPILARSPGAPTYLAPYGALLGGWATRGSANLPTKWFPIGVGGLFTAPNVSGSGGARLYLTVNDFNRGDNSGTFNATVSSTTCAGVSANFAATPTSVFFTYRLGDAAPASQSVSLSASVAVPYTITSTPSFVTVTQDTATTPAKLTISLKLSEITGTGVYSSSIILQSPAVANSLNIPVSASVSGAGGVRPSINAGGVVTVASASKVITPLGLASIYGLNFMTGDATGWDGAKLPTTLRGVSVTIDNKPAYLLYVSPTFINVEVPDTATRGVVNVTVTNANGTSAPVTVQMADIAPELKTWPQSYVEAQHGNASPVAPTGLLGGASPAKPGENISLWALGFGASNPVRAAGEIAQNAPLARTVTVTIGGVAATVVYAGVGGVGLYQMNVLVPESLPDGDHEVVATIAGTTSQRGVKLPVKR